MTGVNIVESAANKIISNVSFVSEHTARRIARAGKNIIICSAEEAVVRLHRVFGISGIPCVRGRYISVASAADIDRVLPALIGISSKVQRHVLVAGSVNGGVVLDCVLGQNIFTERHGHAVRENTRFVDRGFQSDLVIHDFSVKRSFANGIGLLEPNAILLSCRKIFAVAFDRYRLSLTSGFFDLQSVGHDNITFDIDRSAVCSECLHCLGNRCGNLRSVVFNITVGRNISDSVLGGNRRNIVCKTDTRDVHGIIIIQILCGNDLIRIKLILFEQIIVGSKIRVGQRNNRSCPTVGFECSFFCYLFVVLCLNKETPLHRGCCSFFACVIMCIVIIDDHIWCCLKTHPVNSAEIDIIHDNFIITAHIVGRFGKRCNVFASFKAYAMRQDTLTG